MKIEPTLDEHTAAHAAELFRAISNTRRVRIMAGLMRGEANVSGLSGAAGIREPTVSQPVRGPRQMGLVGAHKAGKEVHYRVDNMEIVHAFPKGVKHVQDKQEAAAGWGLPVRRFAGCAVNDPAERFDSGGPADLP